MAAERRNVQNAIFRGKRHDNKILKVQILLSRNFVVIAQAPNFAAIFMIICLPRIWGLEFQIDSPSVSEGMVSMSHDRKES